MNSVQCMKCNSNVGLHSVSGGVGGYIQLCSAMYCNPLLFSQEAERPLPYVNSTHFI